VKDAVAIPLNLNINIKGTRESQTCFHMELVKVVAACWLCY